MAFLPSYRRFGSVVWSWLRLGITDRCSPAEQVVRFGRRL
jgi:hypothetical protein